MPNKKYKLQVRACKGKKCSKYTKAKKAKTHKVPAGAPPFGFNEGIDPGDPGNELLDGSGASFVRVPISWAQTKPTLLGRLQLELHGQGRAPSSPASASSRCGC